MDKKQKARFNVLAVLMSVVIVLSIFSVGYTVNVENNLEGMEEGLTLEQIEAVVSDEVSSIEIPQTDAGEQVSAEEVANLVISKMGKTDEYKLKHLFEKEFSDNISNLEDNASSAVDESLEEGEDSYEVIEDKLRSSVDNFNEFEITDKEFEAEYKQLGFDESDKVAEVSSTVEVKYNLTEGETGTSFKKEFNLNSVVTYEYDSDNEEYEEAEVETTLV